jgi:hypothetical protein
VQEVDDERRRVLEEAQRRRVAHEREREAVLDRLRDDNRRQKIARQAPHRPAARGAPTLGRCATPAKAPPQVTV